MRNLSIFVHVKQSNQKVKHKAMSKQRSQINKTSGNNYSRHEINLAYNACRREGKDTNNGNIEQAANEIRNDWNNARSERSSSSSRIEQPSIRPEGTNGSEWNDYAWTADDL